MSSFSRIQLENWLKMIEIDGNHIADIGGAQYCLKGRTKSWNPDSYVIFDLKKPHNIRIKDWEILDIQNDRIQNKSIYYQGFDTVFMLEVSEYLFNPLQALKNINRLLTKDGIFYSSWHFIYPLHPPLETDFLRYTPVGAEKLLKEAGFEILEHIPRRTEKINLREVWASEQMRGWKEFDNTVIGSLVKAKKI